MRFYPGDIVKLKNELEYKKFQHSYNFDKNAFIVYKCIPGIIWIKGLNNDIDYGSWFPWKFSLLRKNINVKRNLIKISRKKGGKLKKGQLIRFKNIEDHKSFCRIFKSKNIFRIGDLSPEDETILLQYPDTSLNFGYWPEQLFEEIPAWEI